MLKFWSADWYTHSTLWMYNLHPTILQLHHHHHHHLSVYLQWNPYHIILFCLHRCDQRSENVTLKTPNSSKMLANCPVHLLHIMTTKLYIYHTRAGGPRDIMLKCMLADWATYTSLTIFATSWIEVNHERAPKCRCPPLADQCILLCQRDPLDGRPVQPTSWSASGSESR